MCCNGCGRYANSGLNYPTCCSGCQFGCIGYNSNHTQICNSRNPSLTYNFQQQIIPQPSVQHFAPQPYVQHFAPQPIVQPVHRYETILLENIGVSNKSAFLNLNSNLHMILFQITTQLKYVPGYQPPHGGAFHIELVHNPSDSNKITNFMSLQNKQVDLCDKSNWQCLGSGAFCLVVGSPPVNGSYRYKFHVTVGYFGANCQNIMANALQIVERVIGCNLY